jgi:hypothetical protein
MAHELPPPAQMVLLLGGFRISQALYAAAALGVADYLVAGPASAEHLAGRTGAHPPSLRRLLRTLASVGVFTEPEPGVFALTPLGQTLTSSQPGSMRDVAIMFMETHYAPFGDLLGTIRTGQPAAERYYGQPFFAWLSQQPEQASRFTAAMANLTGGFKTAAIAALPLDGTGTIVDVGGADGTVLAAILAAHPQMRGVLFDLPMSSPARPGSWPGTASMTGPSAWEATSSNRSRPEAMPTLPRSSCTTGLASRPAASWRTSPRPAAAARGCC